MKSQSSRRALQGIENRSGRILKRFEPDPADKGFIVRRNTLHDVLRSRVPEIEMNMSAADFKDTTDGIDVRFSDGSTDNFSLVVGADRINSETRNFITRKDGNIFTGQTVLYSGSVIWGVAFNRNYKEIIEVWDNNGMCALYPVTGGTVISFFRRAPKSFSSPPKERAIHIRKYFLSYTQPVIRKVLEDLPVDIFFDHIRYTRPRHWNAGRITLIGDACHSLSPISGMGANLAMADAVGLAQLIRDSDDTENIPFRLEEFNRKRKIEADKAYSISRVRTRRGMAAPPGSWVRNIRIKQSSWKV